MDKQRWTHMLDAITEPLQEQIDDLDQQNDRSLDAEVTVRNQYNELQKDIANFKDKIEVLLKTI